MVTNHLKFVKPSVCTECLETNAQLLRVISVIKYEVKIICNKVASDTLFPGRTFFKL
jgi:hypothetical protein